MKNNFKKTAILALIGAALALQGANAQLTNPAGGPAFGDLIFGAETINGGTAVGNNLEVDLGSITNFTTTAKLTFANVSIADLASVLNAGAGTGNFATASNDFWSVAGTTDISDVGTYFKGAVFATLNTDPGAMSKTGLNPASSALTSMYSGLSTGTTGFTAAPNSHGAGGELAVSNSTSYSATEGTAASATTFFGFGSGGSTTFASGASLNLYALNTAGDLTSQRGVIGTDVLLGSFSFSPTSGLTFTGAGAGTVAAPEPSTYALMFAGLAVLFFLGRRRSLKS